MPQQVLKALLTYLAVAGAFGILALLLVFPLHPKTALGWSLWLTLALPIYGLFEFLCGKVFSRKVGRSISDSDSTVSVTRVTVGVVLALVAIVVAGIAISSISSGSGDFWEANFSSRW